MEDATTRQRASRKWTTRLTIALLLTAMTSGHATAEVFSFAFGQEGTGEGEFQDRLLEDFDEDVDVVVFLQTIEHIEDPDALLDRISGYAPVAYISTPNRLTLAPPGAVKSDNPWHIREYDATEYRALLAAHFDRVELLGLFHAGKLRAHELAIRVGWDRFHKLTRITKPFYDRFIPAIGSSDFVLRDGDLDGALDFLGVCGTGVAP